MYIILLVKFTYKLIYQPLSEPVPQEKEVPTEKLKVNVQPLSEPVKQERQVHTEKLKVNF